MPSVRPRPAKPRMSVALVGPINGSNQTFTTPEDFINTGGTTLALFYNGQRLLPVDDFTLTESGGPSTGFDTVTVLFTPKPGDKLWADYFVV